MTKKVSHIVRTVGRKITQRGGERYRLPGSSRYEPFVIVASTLRKQRIRDTIAFLDRCLAGAMAQSSRTLIEKQRAAYVASLESAE